MTETRTLRETASQCCKQLYIGTAILPLPLFPNSTDENTDETNYGRIVHSEFNSIVIEHHLKWTPLCHSLPGPTVPPPSQPGKYDFSHVDRMLDFAQRNRLHVKGHVLVWHVTSPPWLESMTGQQVRDAVKRHIFTTMAYFRGRIQMWDVVNEALASDGTLVENVFYRKMGPNYVEECFRMAHEADPQAFLIYNDNKVEGCGWRQDQDGCSSQLNSQNRPAPNQQKADGFYNLLKRLVDDGVPIHGAGMQAHFTAGGVKHQRVPTPAMVKRQIRRVGELGLKVNISELDVRVSKLPQRKKDKDDYESLQHLAQTQIYRDVLSAALSEPSFHGIWLWGFTDCHTWVNQFYYPDTPLIFDKNYQKKPSYFGLQQALATLCPGGTVGQMMGGDKCQCYLKHDCNVDGVPWGSEWMPPDLDEGLEENNIDAVTDTTKDGQPDWMQPSSLSLVDHHNEVVEC